MSRKLKSILLIDDNPDDNFYHERVIRKCAKAEQIITMTDAADALEFLRKESEKKTQPELIFLDINMPGMNGLEFLAEYVKFSTHSKVVMLTTSENPDDRRKAHNTNVISDFRIKPLSKEMLEQIISAHFPDN